MLSNRSFRIGLVLVGIFVLFIAALPALAAQGGMLVSYNLNAAECYVDITATVEDAGFYAINFWDDGFFRGGAGANVAAGGSFTVRLTIGGPILQGATGIGVYLQEIAGETASAFYDTDGSAQLWDEEVGLDCADSGYNWGASAGGAAGCTVPLPAGSVVRSVPAGALAYFAPDLGSYAGFNLPPGTWYVAPADGDFAEVWISCQANTIYIPVANVVG